MGFALDILFAAAIAGLPMRIDRPPMAWPVSLARPKSDRHSSSPAAGDAAPS